MVWRVMGIHFPLRFSIMDFLLSLARFRVMGFFIRKASLISLGFFWGLAR